VLLVLKPTDLGERAVYNLDQYLMRGGRVIVCASSYDAQFDLDGLRVAPMRTGLDDWLAHLGVTVGKTLVLDDRNQALPIPEIRQTPLGTLRTWSLAPYPYLVQVRDEGFANRDVTASLDAVGIYWGSPLTVDEKAAEGREVVPILRSSSRSWTDDDSSRVAFVDYEVPAEGTEPRLLAVALGGKFKSYFTERPAPGADAAAGGAGAPPRPPAVPLRESPPTRVVVVGNAAFLSDFVARMIGQVDGSFFLENLRFIENVIDWVSLDSDMLQIRSRGLASRRLERTSKGAEIAIESASYAIPALLLLVLGLNMRWRRRHAAPRFETAPVAAAPGGEQ